MAKSSTSTGGLIGVTYLPHGTMLLDPHRADLPAAARDLHACCMKISETIEKLQPDLVIILTPHGINLHQAFNVYQPGVSGCRASGTAEWNEQWTDYNVNVTLDGQTSLELYSYLKERLPRVEGMLSFAGLSVPLRWGEVVPLYFALHQLASKTQATDTLLKKVSIQSSPRLVIIAQPMKGTTSMRNLDASFIS
jgi:aromatic ring-opening dioxygenase LigB subunit